MKPESRTGADAAWLRLAFRPFFLAAGLFAVLAMALWTALYDFGWQMPAGGLPALDWHAHEMLFGYALAVVAGFLLTAIRNWTGLQTLHGPSLLALFALWTAARLGSLVPGLPLPVVAAADLGFNAFLVLAALLPVARARQWMQTGIIVKLLLLLAANALFYLGVTGQLADGRRLGLYAGLYLILSLILMIGRRVIPFFIQNGVGYPFQARNRKWLDVTVLVLFLLFALSDLARLDALTAALAAVLFVLHGIRIVGWHTRGIWSKPLLWVLFLAYGFIILGFGLKTASIVAGVSPFLALHAFTVGGIGLMTLGMMARVTLGHTGRNVFEPPAAVRWMFGLLAAGAVTRVLLPMLVPARYDLWIALSQGLWILAFGLFVAVYVPMLVTPRVDGKPG